MLAQALLTAGDFVQAREAIDVALVHAATYDDNYYLAELHRLKGEALLVAGESHEVVNPVSSNRWMWPATNKPNRSNCAPL